MSRIAIITVEIGCSDEEVPEAVKHLTDAIAESDGRVGHWSLDVTYQGGVVK